MMLFDFPLSVFISYLLLLGRFSSSSFHYIISGLPFLLISPTYFWLLFAVFRPPSSVRHDPVILLFALLQSWPCMVLVADIQVLRLQVSSAFFPPNIDQDPGRNPKPISTSLITLLECLTLPSLHTVCLYLPHVY